MHMRLLYPPQTDLQVTPFCPETMPPHPRFEATQKTDRAQFLTWCYPRSPEMEQPTVATVSDTEWHIRWHRCEDRILLRTGDTIKAPGIRSDGEMVVLRLRRQKVMAWVLVGGTFLDCQDRRLIELKEGPGNALFADGDLSISGRKITVFTARPTTDIKRARAHGRPIDIRRSGSAYTPAAPLIPRPVLTW